jgi:hypothetical protein
MRGIAATLLSLVLLFAADGISGELRHVKTLLWSSRDELDNFFGYNTISTNADTSKAIKTKMVSEDGNSLRIKDVLLWDNFAVAIVEDSGLYVFDMKTHPDSEAIAKLRLTGRCKKIFINKDLAFISFSTPIPEDHCGMHIVSLAIPLKPIKIAEYKTRYDIKGMQVIDNYTYLAVNYSGFQIVDVSDPETPTLIGTSPTTGGAWDICVSGNYAYLTCFHAGLLIFDITDRRNPTFLASFDTQAATGVEVNGDYAYLFDGTKGIISIDISKPSKPRMVSIDRKEDEPGDPYDFYLKNQSKSKKSCSCHF